MLTVQVAELNSDLDNRVSVNAYLDAKFEHLLDAVHKYPGCSIGAGSLETCRSILCLEQQTQELLSMCANDGFCTAEGDLGKQLQQRSNLVEAIAADCAALAKQSSKVISDGEIASKRVTEDANRQLRDAETTARIRLEEAAHLAEKSQSDAENRMALLTNECAKMQKENVKLKATVHQNRVDSALISRLESEHDNQRKLFESKLHLLQTELHAANCGKAEADARLIAMSKELEQCHNTLLASASVGSRERELLVAKARELQAENNDLRIKTQCGEYTEDTSASDSITAADALRERVNSCVNETGNRIQQMLGDGMPE